MVWRWMKNAREGVVIADAHGGGKDLGQLNSLSGVMVDSVGSVCVGARE